MKFIFHGLFIVCLLLFNTSHSLASDDEGCGCGDEPKAEDGSEEEAKDIPEVPEGVLEGICNFKDSPLKDWKMFFTHLEEVFDVTLAELYPHIRCLHGKLTLLNYVGVHGSGETFALILDEFDLPLNTKNIFGETELQCIVNRMKLMEKEGRSTKTLQFLFRALRTPYNPYSKRRARLNCELDGTCECPRVLTEFGKECTPPQR